MKRRIIASVLAAVLVMMSMTALPALAIAPERDVSAADNEGHWDYEAHYFEAICSYLFENDDGTLTRVEYDFENITVTVHDAEYNVLSTRTMECELEQFGGFYAGSEYNFFVFGQYNLEEDDSVEVIRTVKYSKDWQRLGSVGIYGANTCGPFHHGTLRMTQVGDYLFVRTCHLQYLTSDGLHHQTNIMYSVDIPSMEIAEGVFTYTGRMYGCVSHSFNQFIILDGDRLVALDHGDASPRAAVLFRYTGEIGPNVLHSVCDYVNTFNYPGPLGLNFTGSTLGGLETTSVGYLIAGNSSISIDEEAQRNIYLTITERENFNLGGTNTVWLTNYSNGDGILVGNPQLIKINDDKLMVMWTEARDEQFTVAEIAKCVFVNGSGNVISETVAAPYHRMSDCMPIVVGSRAVWFVTTGGRTRFYSVRIDGDVPEPELNTPVFNELNEALNVEGGSIDFDTNIDAPFSAVTFDDRYVAATYEHEGPNSLLITKLYLEEGDRIALDYKIQTSHGGVSIAVGNVMESIPAGLSTWSSYVFTPERAGWSKLMIIATSGDSPEGCYIDNVRILHAGEPVPEQPEDPLDIALNVEGGSMRFDTYWNRRFDPAWDGDRYVAKSIASEMDWVAEITTVIECEAGDRLVFDYRCSPQSAYGLGLVMNNLLWSVGGPSTEWQRYSYTVESAGTYTFTWQYYHNMNEENWCMIDNIAVVHAGEPDPPPISGIPGDADGDGAVTITDALITLRGAMGLVELTPEQLAACDVNGDGEVNISDALIILRYAMGLIDSL